MSRTDYDRYDTKEAQMANFEEQLTPTKTRNFALAAKHLDKMIGAVAYQGKLTELANIKLELRRLILEAQPLTNADSPRWIPDFPAVQAKALDLLIDDEKTGKTPLLGPVLPAYLPQISDTMHMPEDKADLQHTSSQFIEALGASEGVYTLPELINQIMVTRAIQEAISAQTHIAALRSDGKVNKRAVLFDLMSQYPDIFANVELLVENFTDQDRQYASKPMIVLPPAIAQDHRATEIQRMLSINFQARYQELTGTISTLIADNTITPVQDIVAAARIFIEETRQREELHAQQTVGTQAAPGA